MREDGLDSLENRLQRKNTDAEGLDREFAALNARLRSNKLRGVNESPLESNRVSPNRLRNVDALEAIIYAESRPVLPVTGDKIVLDFRTDEHRQIWEQRLQNAKPNIERWLRSVGRIDAALSGARRLIGTGWLIDSTFIVTNRHVAEVFASQRGTRFTFTAGADPTIDFAEELNQQVEREYQLVEVLHIQTSGPDVAFLRVEPSSGSEALHAAIQLHTGTVKVGQYVAVVGYPARDIRATSRRTMDWLYGNVYEKKRFAPGLVSGLSNGRLHHDCSTLGGNSGSVVFDLATGEAVGLHFAGTWDVRNDAVPISTVQQLLQRVKDSRSPDARPAVRTRPVERGSGNTLVQRSPASDANLERSLEVTVPLKIRVTIGEPLTGEPSSVDVDALGMDVLGESIEEGRLEDYQDKGGYDPAFLGASIQVSLPRVVDEEDVLVFGEGETELKYEHFSVMMSESRRQCWLSAVNIDGGQSRKTNRAGWRTDPRIPAHAQIRNECYGPPPKFSRGHMTRREDPAWGDAQTAEAGNRDSMHVTNTVPQMQTFNGGIWLGLEDYALRHARGDRMRISVFTGPIFSRDPRNPDPVRYGVQIPRAFWKVIAFIHDETGELTATGYRMSQEKHIPGREFVFGQYQYEQGKTAQVSLRAIEEEAGIDFGELSRFDPIERTEGPGAGRGGYVLEALRDIRFF